jgi:hypothetical protein
VTIPLWFSPAAVRTGLPVEHAVWPDRNCSSPPTPQLLAKQVNVVGDAALVEERVELLVVDSVRSLDFAVRVRRPRADVDVPDVEALEVPVEVGLKLRAVVGLDDQHPEG